MSSAPPPGHPPGPPPYQGGPDPGAGHEQQDERKRRTLLLLLLLLLVGAAVAAVAFVLLTRGGDQPEAASGEVLLEAAGSTGPDPFSTTQASPVPSISAPSPSFAPLPANPAGGTAVRGAGGGTAGLYGGTLSNANCDAGQMATFLAQNTDKGAAWAQALSSDSTLRWSGGTSVRPDQLPGYLAQLTPVLLRADTRVTNNGFADGRPTPRQAILQAGTAVLVDTYGVPRARCYCGNPLLAPRAVPRGPVYTGTTWPGFAPGNVVVVQPAAAPMPSITLVNINNGTTFTRPIGTNGRGDQPTTPPPATTTSTAAPPPVPQPLPPAPPPQQVPQPLPPRPVPQQPVPQQPRPPQPGPQQPPPPQPGPQPAPPQGPPLTIPPTVNPGTGDVQVTLLWSTGADADLHVIDPAGQEIYFRAPTSNSGGSLDIDQRPVCGDAPVTHVENIFWPTGGAPPGQYRAFVRNYRGCGETVPYQLQIRVGGQLVYDSSGTLPATDGADSAPVPFSR
jgi:outer membrane biosynthesis protein TonB